MAHTYTQIFVQFVFAVQWRQNLIAEQWRQDLEKYICGIIRNKKSKPLAIYCNPDHCHILISLNPNSSLAEMANAIKTNSSKWINENKLTQGRFAWQAGYGVFSYSRSQLRNVTNYIKNQAEHHAKTTFREEYQRHLTEFGINYEEAKIFEFRE